MVTLIPTVFKTFNYSLLYNFPDSYVDNNYFTTFKLRFFYYANRFIYLELFDYLMYLSIIVIIVLCTHPAYLLK